MLHISGSDKLVSFDLKQSRIFKPEILGTNLIAPAMVIDEFRVAWGWH